ncbi:MAG: DNA replication/repair protein RecF [Anaerolineales bacterium]|nr:DNA replication/repair protein RecF [Anaerolineales bacterium]MCX7609028.1 DNA replication/repair protein RecF [Anaerolineales bacterium]MDW8226634.1 DNA replication/repair protein RecF [Anaerolineales bacterium]
MYLTRISLTNFRLFARLDLEVPRRVILLVGSNAQGKTSLLEAIYFLAAFTSFQTHIDRQLVNAVAAREPLAVARLVAEYRRRDGAHRLEVRLILEPVGPLNGQRLRKEILLDGVKRSVAEAIGHFNAVIFVPQMTQIIEGAPEDRRRYLNLALAQTIPGYASALTEYTQALAQRNALLKTLNERGGDPTQLDFWDEALVCPGAKLIRARISAIQEIEALARPIHYALTRGQEILRLSYQPAYDPARPNGQIALRLETVVDRSGLSEEEIRNGFLEALGQARSGEIARGVTTLGPHRDEVRFLANQIDLGDYGSRGQVRTALLALKLAEVAWMQQKTGEWPVLLLDEVMAELDRQRRADLLAYLETLEQALLSTTDLSLFTQPFIEQTEIWHVQAGTVNLFEKGGKEYVRDS